MYGKLFRSMYDGTLAEDWRALVALQQLVILADADGVVDMTGEAIVRRTGIPADVIGPGLAALEQPDPRSRTEGEEGRRIVPLDGRGWGWQIVNYGQYRRMRDTEDRKRQTKEATARWREKKGVTVSPGEPQVSRGEPRRAHEEEEGDGEGRRTKGAYPERREDGASGPSLFPEAGSGGGDGSEGENVAGRGGGARQASKAEWFAEVEAVPLADGSEWRPRGMEMDEWMRLFPGVDVRGEFMRMRAWALANPQKRKTLRGVRAFVRTWLDREQNRGGRGEARGLAAGPGDRMKAREAATYEQVNRGGRE